MSPLRVASYIAIALLVSFLGSQLYNHILDKGKAIVQKEFDNFKTARNDEILKIKEEYELKAIKARQENQRINDELNAKDKNHIIEVAAIRADTANRLRNSENRAIVYQHQANSGTAECIRLASHATELDRTLEEGRSLVRELRQALVFREEQLILLGQKIQVDQAKYSDTGK